jgi:hypothetical protein
MEKLSVLAVGAIVICGFLLSSTALAGNDGNGNGFPSGAHYNLNIIGVSDKSQVGDSDGHTLFVNLDKPTKILMTQGTEFQVIDRNGCQGAAEFQIAPGYYDVYARALGKPGGTVKINATGNFTPWYDPVTGETLLLLGSVDLTREKGKPLTVPINNLFYVDVTITNGTINQTYNNYWIFAIPELYEYYWTYNNDHLKLLQVRFYENTTYTLPPVEIT